MIGLIDTPVLRRPLGADGAILLALFLFALLSQTTAVLMPFLVADLGYGYTEMGWPVAAGFAVAMLLRPYVGDIVARLGARSVFLSCIVLLILGAFGLAGSTSLNTVVGLRTIVATAAAVFYTAGGIVYLGRGSDADLARRTSLFSMIVIAPSVFTPTLALIARDWFAYSEIFAALGVMSIGLLICTAILFAANPHQDACAQPSETPDAAESLSARQRRAIIAASMLAIVVGNLAIYTATTFLPVFLDRTDPIYAKVFFLIQAPLVVIARFALRRWLPSELSFPFWTFVVAMALSGAAIGAVASFPAWLTVVACAAMAGGILAMLYPGFMTLVTLATPRPSRSRIFGLYIGAADLGAVLGMVFTGVLADAIGFAPALQIVAAVFVCGMMAIALTIRWTLKDITLGGEKR